MYCTVSTLIVSCATIPARNAAVDERSVWAPRTLCESSDVHFAACVRQLFHVVLRQLQVDVGGVLHRLAEERRIVLVELRVRRLAGVAAVLCIERVCAKERDEVLHRDGIHGVRKGQRCVSGRTYPSRPRPDRPAAARGGGRARGVGARRA